VIVSVVSAAATAAAAAISMVVGDVITGAASTATAGPTPAAAAATLSSGVVSGSIRHFEEIENHIRFDWRNRFAGDTKGGKYDFRPYIAEHFFLLSSR